MRTIITVVATVLCAISAGADSAMVFARGASGEKKLIFVGWDTGDLTPAEIVRPGGACGGDTAAMTKRFRMVAGPNGSELPRWFKQMAFDMV